MCFMEQAKRWQSPERKPSNKSGSGEWKGQRNETDADADDQ